MHSAAGVLTERGGMTSHAAVIGRGLGLPCIVGASDVRMDTKDKKLVGPAYKDVAAKYAGQKDAVDKLAAKIIKGGSGVWGPVPMPANAQVNEAEAKKLAAWVLTQK